MKNNSDISKVFILVAISILLAASAVAAYYYTQDNPVSSNDRYIVAYQGGAESSYNVRFTNLENGNVNICLETSKLEVPTDGETYTIPDEIKVQKFDSEEDIPELSRDYVPETIEQAAAKQRLLPDFGKKLPIVPEPGVSVVPIEIKDHSGTEIDRDSFFPERDTARFCYEADPSVDRYLKFGDHSIVIIAAGTLLTGSSGFNFFWNASINVSDPINMKWSWNNVNYTIYDNFNLVARYNFDNVSAIGESATGATDISSYGNNATIANGDVVDGKYGRGLHLTGLAGSYANVPYSQSLSFNNSNALTACLWARQNSSFVSGGAFLADQWRTNGNGRIWYLIISAAGKPSFAVGNTTGGYTGQASVTSSWVMPTDEWHYLCGQWNGTAALLYTDGVLTGYGTGAQATLINDSAVNLTIGSIGDVSADFFNGTIDEVRIYNYSLSASQIAESYVYNLNKFDIDSYIFQVNKNATAGNYSYYVCATNSTNSESCTSVAYASLGTEQPSISYQDPTPTDYKILNNATINLTFTLSNITYNTDGLWIDRFIFNLNGTNYTLAGRDLTLAYNFDNVSALGENSTLVANYGNSTSIQIYPGNGTQSSATNAVYCGQTAGCPLLTSGISGSAYSLNGKNNSLIINPSEYGTTLTSSSWNYVNQSDFTISLWAKIGVGGCSSGTARLVQGEFVGNANTGGLLITVGCNATGTTHGVLGAFGAYAYNLTSDATTASLSASCSNIKLFPDNDTWHMETFVWDWANKRQLVYVDGALACNSSMHTLFVNSPNTYYLPYLGFYHPAASAFTGRPITIGSRGTDNYFNGSIDEFKIWKRTLTPEEVKMNYNSILTRNNLTDFTFNFNATNYTEGNYSYYGFVNDTYIGNSATATRHLLLDKTKPQISILAPTAGQTYQKSTSIITTTITNNSDASSVYYSINGGSQIAYTTDQISYPDGTVTLTAYAYDLAGNVNSASVTFNLETSALHINLLKTVIVILALVLVIAAVSGLYIFMNRNWQDTSSEDVMKWMIIFFIGVTLIIVLITYIAGQIT